MKILSFWVKKDKFLKAQYRVQEQEDSSWVKTVPPAFSLNINENHLFFLDHTY